MELELTLIAISLSPPGFTSPSRCRRRATHASARAPCPGRPSEQTPHRATLATAPTFYPTSRSGRPTWLRHQVIYSRPFTACAIFAARRQLECAAALSRTTVAVAQSFTRDARSVGLVTPARACGCETPRVSWGGGPTPITVASGNRSSRRRISRSCARTSSAAAVASSITIVSGRWMSTGRRRAAASHRRRVTFSQVVPASSRRSVELAQTHLLDRLARRGRPRPGRAGAGRSRLAVACRAARRASAASVDEPFELHQIPALAPRPQAGDRAHQRALPVPDSPTTSTFARARSGCRPHRSPPRCRRPACTETLRRRSASSSPRVRTMRVVRPVSSRIRAQAIERDEERGAAATPTRSSRPVADSCRPAS